MHQKRAFHSLLCLLPLLQGLLEDDSFDSLFERSRRAALQREQRERERLRREWEMEDQRLQRQIEQAAAEEVRVEEAFRQRMEALQASLRHQEHLREEARREAEGDEAMFEAMRWQREQAEAARLEAEARRQGEARQQHQEQEAQQEAEQRRAESPDSVWGQYRAALMGEGDLAAAITAVQALLNRRAAQAVAAVEAAAAKAAAAEAAAAEAVAAAAAKAAAAEAAAAAAAQAELLQPAKRPRRLNRCVHVASISSNSSKAEVLDQLLQVGWAVAERGCGLGCAVAVGPGPAARLAPLAVECIQSPPHVSVSVTPVGSRRPSTHPSTLST